ncbi:Os12g0124600 [Oryza sativa Japonica Group]|uniref:Os12g0124600 protein n=1 Tax=Oryza sativa subsp. japonica TaxID=39947 RepID=A0A0P0Y6N0_ORYSJ|nr:hypothetical protein DAI22_12g018200 [Oryza sativa Japonica Group]BAT15683.1 Os12g0124600 [Oryza sativa Japonica Group]
MPWERRREGGCRLSSSAARGRGRRERIRHLLLSPHRRWRQRGGMAARAGSSDAWERRIWRRHASRGWIRHRWASRGRIRRRQASRAAWGRRRRREWIWRLLLPPHRRRQQIGGMAARAGGGDARGRWIQRQWCLSPTMTTSSATMLVAGLLGPTMASGFL